MVKWAGGMLLNSVAGENAHNMAYGFPSFIALWCQIHKHRLHVS